MKATIEPGEINGIITAPPSKSMTQRVLAAALLHTRKTIIYNAGNSADELAARQIILALGAKVTDRGGNIIEVESQGVDPVTGNLTNTADSIHCGESGLAARLFIPIAALSNKPIKITGEGSLLKRPMYFFEQVLPQLGVIVTSHNGCLPIELKGHPALKSIKVDGSVSSQFLSGLLFLFAAAGRNTRHAIEVSDLKSRPYVDMTIEVLRKYGYGITTDDNYTSFYAGDQRASLIPPGQEVAIAIEGDWSSAAALLVAGAIAGKITVKNLDMHSKQADRAIIDVLQAAGAAVLADGSNITVQQAALHAFEYDATHSPDLFPVLSILAACCNGESYIKGVHRLFHKESNRAESISEMLENFSVPFSIEGDMLCITGVKKLQGTVIDSCHDHRIVMAAAIGALRANSRVDILHAEAVDKSYPAFFNDLGDCGGNAY